MLGKISDEKKQELKEYWDELRDLQQTYFDAFAQMTEENDLLKQVIIDAGLEEWLLGTDADGNSRDKNAGDSGKCVAASHDGVKKSWDEVFYGEVN